MKKFFLMLALLSSAALFGETVGFDIENGLFKINTAGVLKLTYYSPGSKYGQVSEFGYYYAGAPEEKFVLDTEPNGNKTVTIENVKKDDQIGLYFKTQTTGDVSLFSEAQYNLGADADKDFLYEVSKNNGSYITFGDPKWMAGNVIAFKAVAEDGGTGPSTDGDGPSEPEDGTSGQPLPGLLTTLLIAGGAGTVMARRRKNNKA